MGLPDFICIGAQKAGTSWLYANLAQHPEIWTPFTKELHYFDAPVTGTLAAFRRRHVAKLAEAMKGAVANRAPAGRIAYLRGLSDEAAMFTPDWYRLIFSRKPPGKIAGEFTPRYSTLPEKTLDEMIAFVPHAKMIYLIRDPVARARSSFRMAVRHGGVDPADPVRIDAFARNWDAKRGWLGSQYADFIPRWDARRVEGETLLYLPFGAIKTRPVLLLREVETFLGLRPYAGYGKIRRKVNRTAGVPLPDWFEDRLKDRMERHRAFLASRFPADFVAEIG
ncbi:sulfotransferase [Pikeienuella piscinae]|uniref:Sulfotransferase n=1 Tax=Pikeienuella piscinae TaxID=2748098 RepID=A0A7M3T5P7_9RHOB|nr:sulfotransferase [Pikeienuella piscinae]QIE57328.1 sulfotransferase [Pikeienuella piscinae]